MPAVLCAVAARILVPALGFVGCQASLDLSRFRFDQDAGVGGRDGALPPAGAAGSGGAAGTRNAGAGAGGASSGSSGQGGSSRGGTAGSSTGSSQNPGRPPLDPRDAGAPECGCTLAHADAVCLEGACAIASCVGPFRDDNALADDGCETGDVPEGSSLWFMADRGVNAELDGAVVRWDDQSSNQVAAQQTVPARRPALETAADGLPLLAFDGSDDFFDLPAGFASFAGVSFFAVVEALPNPLCAGLLHFSNGPDGDDVEFGRHRPNLLYYEVLGSVGEGTPEAFVVDRRLVVSIVQTPTTGGMGNAELRIDGNLDAVRSVALPATVVRGQNYVGRNAYSEQPEVCSMYYRGRIGELLFYARGVSSAERERVEAYLNAKWQPP